MQSLLADEFMEQTRIQCPVGSGCHQKREKTENVPEALVRVVNRVQKGGSAQLDKGSGSIIEENGMQWILTAAHIFREGIGDVSITTQEGATLKAEVVVRNTLYDVVLLKLERRLAVRPISFAKEAAQQGERTIGWGFGPNGTPIGQVGKVVGYVMTNKSGTHETLKTTGRAREGDSGGAVLNESGDLVGLLWGTDGQHTYSTYGGRLRKILGETTERRNPSQEPEVSAPGLTNPPVPVVPTAPTLPSIKGLILTSLIEKGMIALGISTPASIMLYYLTKTALRRKKSRRTEKPDDDVPRSTKAKLNDNYATQLNELYELSGHSSTADATLGRLYDRKLQDAEQSSSAELASFAKLLRKQVADQFLRIHSTNPTPTE